MSCDPWLEQLLPSHSHMTVLPRQLPRTLPLSHFPPRGVLYIKQKVMIGSQAESPAAPQRQTASGKRRVRVGFVRGSPSLTCRDEHLNVSTFLWLGSRPSQGGEIGSSFLARLLWMIGSRSAHTHFNGFICPNAAAWQKMLSTLK